jgi:hypothetical protein
LASGADSAIRGRRSFRWLSTVHTVRRNDFKLSYAYSKGRGVQHHSRILPKWSVRCKNRATLLFLTLFIMAVGLGLNFKRRFSS